MALASSPVAAWNTTPPAGVASNTPSMTVRCLAMHANPVTGVRDLEVMQTLVRTFSQQQPTFGAGMLSCASGGVRAGDTVNRVSGSPPPAGGVP